MPYLEVPHEGYADPSDEYTWDIADDEWFLEAVRESRESRLPVSTSQSRVKRLLHLPRRHASNREQPKP